MSNRRTTKIDELCCVNVNDLKRWVRFAGSPSTIKWSIGGETIAVAAVIAIDSEFRFFYKFRMNGAGDVVCKDRVQILKTNCYFGQTRTWFQCPHCYRRVGKLYFWNGLRCRNCCGLRYQSQSDGKWNRAITKRNKSMAQLGSTHAFDLQRPKGMHAKTYCRQVELVKLYDEMASNCLTNIR